MEFFRCVLMRLHEELPYPQSKNEEEYCAYKNPLKSASFGSDYTEDSHNVYGTTSISSTTTRSSTSRNQSTHTSIISNVFQGLFESRIKCLNCKNVIYNFKFFKNMILIIHK